MCNGFQVQGLCDKCYWLPYSQWVNRFFQCVLDISQILMVSMKEVDQTHKTVILPAWLEINSIKIRKNVLDALKGV
jgi:hypothetical protein